MADIQALKEKLSAAERALQAAQFEHAKALQSRKAAQTALGKAMSACYTLTVPDVRLPEWTYMRPDGTQEAGPEPLAALMCSLGMGEGISEHTVLCSIHAQNGTTSLQSLLATYPHLRLIVSEVRACKAAAQEAARRSDESNDRVKREQYMCAIRWMMLVGARSGTQQWARHLGDGPLVNPKEIDGAMKSGTLQDSEIFLSANGAAMKSAAQIVSDWRECEIGLRLIIFIGQQWKGMIDLDTFSAWNVVCWCYPDADGNTLGPYSATRYWGWVQSGHWPGSALVHLKSLPEHRVSIDSLQSIIDKVMGAVAAVRQASAKSPDLPEPSAKHPAEMVAAASTKLRMRLAEIMQHKVLPNVVRKSMEDVLIQWLADRKAGRLPPPKPPAPAVTPKIAQGAAAAVDLSVHGNCGATKVLPAGAQQTCGQPGSSQPNGGVPPPAAAAAARPTDWPIAPVTIDWRAATNAAPSLEQPKPAASWDAAVAAAFDGGVPLHGSHPSRANGTGPPPAAAPLDGPQNGASEALNKGWPPCSGRHLSSANTNGWPPGSTVPPLDTTAMVNGGIPCPGSRVDGAVVKDATAPQAAAQGHPGRKRSRWDAMAPSCDARLKNGLSSSDPAGRGSHTNAVHSSAPACVSEQRATDLPRSGQALDHMMSGRNSSTPHAAHQPQDASQECKCSQGMSGCELARDRESLSYRRWRANMALENVESRFVNIPWKVFQIVGDEVKRARQQREREKVHARRSLSGTAPGAALTDAAAVASPAAVQGNWPPTDDKRGAIVAQSGSEKSAAGTGQSTEAPAEVRPNAAAAVSPRASQNRARDAANGQKLTASQGAASVPGTAALASSPAAILASTKGSAVAAGAPSQGVCQPLQNGAASTAVARSQGASRAPGNGRADGGHLATIRTVAQPAAAPGAVPNGRVHLGAAAAQRAPETASILRRSSSGKHEPIRFSPPISSPRKSVWERMSPRTKVQPAPVWDRLGPSMQASAAKADKSPSPASPLQQTPSPPQTPASARRARVRVNLLNGGREAARETHASRGEMPDQASPVQEPVQARQSPSEVRLSPAKQPASKPSSRSESAWPTLARKEQAAAVEQQVSAADPASAPQQSDSGPRAALPLSLQQSTPPAQPHGGSRKAAPNVQLSQHSKATDAGGLSNAAEPPLCSPSSGGPDTAAGGHLSTNEPPTGPADTGAKAATCTSAPCADAGAEAAVTNAPTGTPVREAEVAASAPRIIATNPEPQAASMPVGTATALGPSGLHGQPVAADSPSALQIDSAADGCSLAGSKDSHKDSAGVQLATHGAANTPTGTAATPEADLPPATAPNAVQMDAVSTEAAEGREGTPSLGAQTAPACAVGDRGEPENSADAVSISGTDEDEGDNYVCRPNDLIVGYREGKPIILRDYTMEEFREACLGIKELLRARGKDDQIRPLGQEAAAEAAAAAAAAAAAGDESDAVSQDGSDDQSQDESDSESSDESDYMPGLAEATPSRSAAASSGKRRRGNDKPGPAKKRSRRSISPGPGDDYEGDSCHPGGVDRVAKPLGKGALRELMGLACDMDSLPVRSAVQLQPTTFKEFSQKQQHAPVRPLKPKHPGLKGKVTKPRSKAKRAPNGKLASRNGKRSMTAARRKLEADKAANKAVEQYEGVCSRALPFEAVSRKCYLAAQARQAADAQVSAQPAVPAEGRAGRLQVRQLARSDVTHDLATWQKLQGRADDLRLGRSGVHAWGLFAHKPIPGNEFVIEYVGELIRRTVNDVRERADADSDYRFRVDADWVVDATRRGGKARFINHCCDPNCYTKTVSVNGQLHIMIYSKRPIQEGEELTYDYKFQPTPGEAPIPCTCGAKNCRKRLN